MNHVANFHMNFANFHVAKNKKKKLKFEIIGFENFHMNEGRSKMLNLLNCFFNHLFHPSILFHNIF